MQVSNNGRNHCVAALVRLRENRYDTTAVTGLVSIRNARHVQLCGPAKPSLAYDDCLRTTGDVSDRRRSDVHNQSGCTEWSPARSTRSGTTYKSSAALHYGSSSSAHCGVSWPEKIWEQMGSPQGKASKMSSWRRGGEWALRRGYFHLQTIRGFGEARAGASIPQKPWRNLPPSLPSPSLHFSLPFLLPFFLFFPFSLPFPSLPFPFHPLEVGPLKSS